MILKNIALLTGLSLAGAISTSVFLPAQAISLANWLGTDIVSGGTTFDLAAFSTTGINDSLAKWSNYDAQVTNLAPSYLLDLTNPGAGGILTGGLNAGTYTFDYIITTTGADFINSIALNINGTGLSGVKQAWLNGFGDPGSQVADLTTGGLAVSTPITPTQKLYVRDTFTLTSSSTANFFSSATNTAQIVPWETDVLPVVGAVAFFGAGMFAKKKLAQKKTKKVNLES